MFDVTQSLAQKWVSTINNDTMIPCAFFKCDILAMDNMDLKRSRNRLEIFGGLFPPASRGQRDSVGDRLHYVSSIARPARNSSRLKMAGSGWVGPGITGDSAQGGAL